MSASRHSELRGGTPRTDEALALYDRYARPLEKTHRGRYVAVSTDGEVLLDDDLLALTAKAKRQFGPGSFIFKLGEIAVGKWLCLMPS